MRRKQQMTFEELNLLPPLLKAVHEQGYTEPTPVQAQAIPLILSGQDVLAGAQTGTGKTAGFSLPLLQLLSTNPARQPGAIRVLALTPTRELAAQIGDSIKIYGKHLKLSSMVIFGGVGAEPQIRRLQKHPDIVVATPGRLLDLQEQGHVDLRHVEILVLDEADRMLDMGFIHDVKKIMALLPRERQSLLFSATLSREIRDLAGELLNDPQSVQVAPPHSTAQRIQQTIYPVGRDRKTDALRHLILHDGWSQVLVFTRTKFTANQVARSLEEHGISALALHGNKSQSARTEALDKFKNGQLQALVATDIAARGIDIDELPQVVNYDIPNVPEDYVHRIGRTGRAGAEGQAASLVCMDEEGFMHAIERFTHQQIAVKILPDYGPAPDEKAEPIAMGRQILWGGLGKAPSPAEMQAAARSARRALSERMRANKAARGSGGERRKQAPRTKTEAAEDAPARPDDRHGAGGAAADNSRRRPGGRRSRSRGRGGKPAARTAQEDGQRQPHSDHSDHSDERDGANGNAAADELPRNVDPLQINLSGARNRRHSPGGSGSPEIPDPLRTGADVMGKGSGRHRRSGHGGGNRRKGSGR